MEGAGELLRRELGTLWRVDDAGRLAGVRFSDPGVIPWVVVASAAGGGGGSERVWACSTGLGDEVVDEVNALLSGGAPVAEVVGLVPPGRVEEGPSYVGPAVGGSAGSVRVACRVGRTPADRAALEGLLPERDRVALVEPWAAALADDGAVGSVCETARDAPEVGGAEAGVWTYEAYRRRGLAAAAVAEWMEVQAGRGRTPFYSTSADNLASQRVARRLELRPVGWWWSVRP